MKQVVLQARPGLDIYRQDFLDSCIEYADLLRAREHPEGPPDEKVLADCSKLKHVRDHIIDWILLEGSAAPSDQFTESLLSFLKKLRALKSRPPELSSWNDAWYEAHSLFVYESFLYIVAALLKVVAFTILNRLFSSHCLLPEGDRYGDVHFERFECFYSHSHDTLQAALAPKGQRLYSPAAELFKRQADRSDLPFGSIIEAELLVLMMAFITPGSSWYPQAFYYSPFGGDVPFFLKATQHRNFKKLATITGIDDADKLRAAVLAGIQRLRADGWHSFGFR